MRITCKIEDCTKPRRCKGWCHTHYYQWYRTGDPVPKRKYNPEIPSYPSIHYNLIKIHGQATQWVCEHCIQPGTTWAYDHNDPNELISDKGFPYSLNLDNYIPLCYSCHRKFDKKFKLR